MILPCEGTVYINSTDLLAHKAIKLKRKEIVLGRIQIDGFADKSDKEEWVTCVEFCVTSLFVLFYKSSTLENRNNLISVSILILRYDLKSQ